RAIRWMRRSARCRRRGRRAGPATGFPPTRPRARAGSSALRSVLQLVALGAHAVVGEPRLLEVAIAVGIGERAPGPDQETAAERVLVDHRTDRAVVARP